MQSTRIARTLAVLATTLLAISACSPLAPSAAPTQAGRATELWPAPSNSMELATQAGLVPEVKEQLAKHVHAHLDVFVDGKPVLVPAGIGINIGDPEVKKDQLPDGSLNYGGISLCAQPCISPLHTHDESGVLHTESAIDTLNTLGQFFTEWGVTLSATCVADRCSPATPVAFYVNGQQFTGDPNTIQLGDLMEIAVIIGTPPATIPSTGDFTRA